MKADTVLMELSRLPSEQPGQEIFIFRRLATSTEYVFLRRPFVCLSVRSKNQYKVNDKKELEKNYVYDITYKKTSSGKSLGRMEGTYT